MEKIIKWKDFEFVVRDFELSHANGGRLGKLWVEDLKSGRIFLVKGSGKFSYEPFSEKMAYIIGKNLGIDVLEYDIVPAELFRDVLFVNPKCSYVSICEKIDRKGYSISSIAEIKRARNAIIEDEKDKVTNKQVMYEILPKEYIDTMLLFDAIIGNEDRHYGNVHVIRGKNGEIAGAPILDNGAGLLALRSTFEIMLFGNRAGEIYNRSFTTETTHDRQLEGVDQINNIDFNITSKTIQILSELKPTLDLMPERRAKVIRQFVVYRLHKYLGMIKYDSSREYLIKRKNFRRILKENEQSKIIGLFS